MTEVAQVAAAVAHDMDDVTNENEHGMSDAENKEEDVTHEEEEEEEQDVAVDEGDDTEKKSEETSQEEDKKACHTNDEDSTENDKPHVNGVEHKEKDKDDKTNGEATDDEEKEDAHSDTNEDRNMSELALKKEKLLRSRKPVARTYMPKVSKEKGDVTSKYEAMQKAREDRSRLRSRDEQQKRKEQFVKEREWSRRKQQVKDR